MYYCLLYTSSILLSRKRSKNSYYFKCVGYSNRHEHYAKCDLFICVTSPARLPWALGKQTISVGNVDSP